MMLPSNKVRSLLLYMTVVLPILIGCRSTARETAREYVKKELRWLIGQLECDRVYIRRFAAQRLSNLGSRTVLKPLAEELEDEAIRPLIKALEDVDEQVRHNAAIALVSLGDIRAVRPLISVLQDKQEWGWTRCYAAEALGNIGNSSAIEPLIEALKDEDVRDNAAWALNKITRQDFGENYDKWKEWYEKNKSE